MFTLLALSETVNFGGWDLVLILGIVSFGIAYLNRTKSINNEKSNIKY